ncbi:DUF6809 family protein [Congzhengia sp.]|uniref:DUF6809 family protein n=1 Tax=Congzhengia sp. TaxID=2944168 RepID=UPI003076881A
MKTLLQKLYSGELDPTKYYVPKSVEFWKQDEAVNNILKKWTKKIGQEEQLDLFDEMLSIYTRMSAIESEEMFQHGFNLAVKLMSEAYSAKLPNEADMTYANKTF